MVSSPDSGNDIIRTVLLFNYSTIIDPILRDVRTCVIELAGAKAGDRVLDVCCGTGEQVFHYEQKGAIAIGVDENPNMIELAERSSKRRGFNNSTFRMAGAAELPFPDGYFDCASISLGLHEMEKDERNRAVSEMKRVVKKDGALMFIDFQVPLPGNLTAYLIKAIEFIAGKENHRCFRNYLAQGGLKGILKENQLIPQEEALLLSGNIQVIKSKVKS
ncbi:MAG: methyltransferase domain-containing protein [Dehalococcoidia bacterium]|nr:methyltransferase domain-containing protein [Dehalococcoidia bacterium]